MKIENVKEVKCVRTEIVKSLLCSINAEFEKEKVYVDDFEFDDGKGKADFDGNIEVKFDNKVNCEINNDKLVCKKEKSS